LFTGRDIIPDKEQLGKLDPGAVRQQETEYLARMALPPMTPPIPGVMPRGGSAWEGMFAPRTKPQPPGSPEGKARSVRERAAYAAGFKVRKLDVKQEEAWRVREIQDLAQVLRGRIRKVVGGKPEAQWTLKEQREVEKLQDNFMAEAEKLTANLERARQ